MPDELPTTDTALGYFLADVQLNSIHSNHYPFLVPFLGVPTKDKQRIKSYTSLLFSDNEIQSTDCTPTQLQLNDICFRMRKLAAVEPIYRWRRFCPNSGEKEKGSQLMELWHEAKQLILSEKYVHYYYTHGLTYLHGKPKRDWVRDYSIRKERPQLIIKRLDKGEYFQLELRFRVSKKLHIPEKTNFAFFINGTTDTKSLYLLDQFTDYQLVTFFAPFGYKLAVLKCHYRDELKDFVETLADEYEVVKD